VSALLHKKQTGAAAATLIDPGVFKLELAGSEEELEAAPPDNLLSLSIGSSCTGWHNQLTDLLRYPHTSIH
jgi:hypothetical protein